MITKKLKWTVLMGLIATLVSGAIAATSSGLPAEFESLNGTTKQEILWGKITASPYSSDQLTLTGPGLFDFFKAVNPLFVAATFLNTGDEMAQGRVKLIHANGSVAKVRWVPTGNSYTGIFQSGAIGFARLSIATPSTSNFIPGMGLKLFIDQQSSTNLVAMNSLDGQGTDQDFFLKPFTTAIPAPSSIALQLGSVLFKNALPFIDHAPVNERTIPLLDMASMHSDGTLARGANAPYSLVFVPTAAVRNAYGQRQMDEDFRIALSRLSNGMVLYEIFAKATEAAAAIKVGELVAESEFVASRYEDQNLFFRHPKNKARN